MKYDTWKLVNESLAGSTTLGIVSPVKVGGPIVTGGIAQGFVEDGYPQNPNLEDDEDDEDDEDFNLEDEDSTFPPEDASDELGDDSPEEGDDDFLKDINPALLGKDFETDDSIGSPEIGADSPKVDAVPDDSADAEGQPCPDCNIDGHGSEIEDCETCSGTGFVGDEIGDVDLTNDDADLNASDEMDDDEFEKFSSNMDRYMAKYMRSEGFEEKDSDDQEDNKEKEPAKPFEKFKAKSFSDFKSEKKKDCCKDDHKEDEKKESSVPGTVGFAPVGVIGSRLGTGFTMDDVNKVIPVMESKGIKTFQEWIKSTNR